MAHFARLENNSVKEVIVVKNEVLGNKEFPESELIGIEFLKGLYGQDTEWKQTSYNNNFRGEFAGIGKIYKPDTDQFTHLPLNLTITEGEELTE